MLDLVTEVDEITIVLLFWRGDLAIDVEETADVLAL